MNWFYFDGSERKGPVSSETLRKLAATGVVGAQTLVQNENGATARAENVRGLFASETNAAASCDVAFSTAESQGAVAAQIAALEKKIADLTEKTAAFGQILTTLEDKLNLVSTLIDASADETPKLVDARAEQILAKLRNLEEKIVAATTSTPLSYEKSAELFVSQPPEPVAQGTSKNLSMGLWHVGVDLAPGRYRAIIKSEYGCFRCENADGELVHSFFLEGKKAKGHCVVELENGDVVQCDEPMKFEYLSAVIKKRSKE